MTKEQQVNLRRRLYHLHVTPEGHKKNIVLIDADDQSKTTESLHSKALKVHTDKGFSEDEKKQHVQADAIVELWETDPRSIFLIDTSARDTRLVSD